LACAWPVPQGRYFQNSEYSGRAYEMVRRLYRDEGMTFTIGTPAIILPMGRTVGGSTVLSSGSCFRLPADVLTTWRQDFGLADASDEVLAPYYERVERALNVTKVPLEAIGRNNLIFKQGADALGLVGDVIPRNIDGCEGSGICCFGCPTAAKKSAQLAYLPEAMARGTRVYASCRVERVVMQGAKATGVEATCLDLDGQPTGHRLRVHARAVVLAAGTLYTPPLLWRSGIRHRHLGRHVHIHPAAKAHALMDEVVMGGPSVPQSYYIDALTPDGICYEGIHVPPELTASSIPGHGAAHKALMENYNHLAAFGFLVRDESEGRIFNVSGRPNLYYQLREVDMAKIRKGLSIVARAFFAAGARELYPPVHGMPPLRCADEVGRLDAIRAKDLDLSAFHPLGSARMGANPSRSVVAPDGRLHGVENVYICDASIFPSALGVNPQVSIMTFAIKTAEGLAQRLGARQKAA
jgi:choline dehydrogenase-like flavoprotein